MKRPSSAIIPIQPIPINVRSQSQFDPASQTLQKQHSLHQNTMEIKSSFSTNKVQKVPDSMKNFLKERKFIRQIPQQNFFNNQNLIQSRKHLLDSSFLPFQETRSKQQNQGMLQHQNPSEIYLNQRQSYERSPSKQKSLHTLICPICEGELNDQNMIKAFTCRHIFCEQCAKSYTKFKISMFERVPCPQESCASFLDTDSKFYKGLSKRQRRICKKINNFYTTQGDISKKLCPKENCEGVITLKQSTHSQQCPDCKGKFCSSCFLQVHQGKCTDYEVRFMEDTLHYRQCVKCRIVVQRIQGCNHMICKCGYEFCYICGCKWKPDHVCNPNDLEDNGCDWGQNWQDHFIFLVKIPLKFLLTLIYSTFWFGISFAAAPYNLFFFMYWMVIIFLGGAWDYIFGYEERPCWEILLLLIIFPLLIIFCLPMGIRLFLDKFQEECPFISEGYRFIIQI